MKFPFTSDRRQRILRRVMLAMACLSLAGLIVAWFVAGTLVAPVPRFVGEPPSQLHATSFTIDCDGGGRIAGWHARARSSAGVVVLLHGIRGSRLSMVRRAELLLDEGYSVVLIDLQAHGESPGEQITLGFREQHGVRAAVELARTQHPHQPIGVIGVSLGGASALLASPLGIDALVLESVYPNINDAIGNRVSASLGPFSTLPTTLLTIQLKPRLGVSPSQLRPIDHLADINCAVLLACGTDDKHTTVDETRQMYAAARAPKRIWLVDGAAHEDLLQAAPVQYEQQVLEFLNMYLRSEQAGGD